MAAIVFSEKLTLKGWLPRPGSLTRTAEGLGKCGAAVIAGVSPCGDGLLGAIGLIAPLYAELTSGLTDGLDSVVEGKSELVEGTSAKYSEPRVFSLDFSSERVRLSRLLVLSKSFELGTSGVGVREFDLSA